MLSEPSIRRLCSDFGARVKAARQKAGLTPQALGDLVGLSRSSIANLEAGRQRVPIHVIWNLVSALDVRVAELLPEPTTAESLPNPEVTRFLKQEPRLNKVSSVSKQRVREFVQAKLAEIAGTPSSREA